MRTDLLPLLRVTELAIVPQETAGGGKVRRKREDTVSVSALSAYPNNPAARKAMSAQAKCRKAR